MLRRIFCVAAVGFAMLSVVAGTAQAQTLVADYKFNNSGNLGLDSSPFANDATNTAVTQGLDRFAALSAGNFNGTTSVLTEPGGLTGYDGLLPGFTWAGWVNRSSADAGWGGIVSQSTTVNRFLISPTDTPYVNAGNHGGGAGDFDFGSPAVPNNAWVHLVMTADDSVPGNDVKIYMNGAQVWATHTYAHNLVNSSLLDTFIGAGNGPDHHLQGLLDDVQIYDGVLTAQQVSNLFQFGQLAIPEPASIALWSILGVALVIVGVVRRQMK